MKKAFALIALAFTVSAFIYCGSIESFFSIDHSSLSTTTCVILFLACINLALDDDWFSRRKKQKWKDWN